MTTCQQLVEALDTASRSAEERAWRQVAPLGAAAVSCLAAAYPRFLTWQGRASLVYHALPYARTHDEAFALGLAAATERAKVVRYRAISLPAYAQRPQALALLDRLAGHPHADTAADADAIRCGSHHFFHDRTHSGMVTWRVHEP